MKPLAGSLGSHNYSGVLTTNLEDGTGQTKNPRGTAGHTEANARTSGEVCHYRPGLICQDCGKAWATMGHGVRAVRQWRSAYEPLAIYRSDRTAGRHERSHGGQPNLNLLRPMAVWAKTRHE